ncbi:hypothetical protein Taro_012224 [Colocasia esculenta]|uniref:Uncharacterized protein n=1 Tax=Colocasia esculenta TaxID=4460 RepID=A0A843UIG7_COLES|nr:hypothetical protein [Colocasia esculenta]
MDTPTPNAIGSLFRPLSGGNSPFQREAEWLCTTPTFPDLAKVLGRSRQGDRDESNGRERRWAQTMSHSRTRSSKLGDGNWRGKKRGRESWWAGGQQRVGKREQYLGGGRE